MQLAHSRDVSHFSKPGRYWLGLPLGGKLQINKDPLVSQLIV